MTEALFVKAVREYIALVNSVHVLTPSQLLTACAELLPRIYSLGQRLPDLEPFDSPDVPRVDNPMRAIGAVLGKYNEYAAVFDPVFDRTALTALLSDDLADIYVDLVGPLALYDMDKPEAHRNAIWQWQFNIRTHCGDHIVDALRPIHRLVYDHLGADFSSVSRAG
jgi:hypothetical protein